MRADGMAWCQLLPLNYFLSKTTRPISTKFGRKHY